MVFAVYSHALGDRVWQARVSVTSENRIYFLLAKMKEQPQREGLPVLRRKRICPVAEIQLQGTFPGPLQRSFSGQRCPFMYSPL